MSVTFKEVGILSRGYNTPQATDTFSQENLTTLIKTYRKVINSSDLAYTMSLAQGQILNENGIRIFYFRFSFSHCFGQQNTTLSFPFFVFYFRRQLHLGFTLKVLSRS